MNFAEFDPPCWKPSKMSMEDQFREIERLDQAEAFLNDMRWTLQCQGYPAHIAYQRVLSIVEQIPETAHRYGAPGGPVPKLPSYSPDMVREARELGGASWLVGGQQITVTSKPWMDDEYVMRAGHCFTWAIVDIKGLVDNQFRVMNMAPKNLPDDHVAFEIDRDFKRFAREREHALSLEVKA